ncbi:MAG: AAA family ATPase, partial [Candidatus Altiarchaeales archaeon HGW-Altiarchaeales-2]
GVAKYVLMAYSGKKEEQLIPPIDIEFIRKYIAYARKNLNPVLGEVAQKKIEEYYLQLRRESSKDVVQITARQLEGIIRISCASAKMRLRNVVEEDDVNRAIRLMEYSMNLIARDKETGKIDVDRVTYGPKEKRDKIKNLSEILEYLTENGKKHCFIQDFVKQAMEQGIDEKDAKNFVENAKREGKIFEPKDGEIGMIF